MAKTVNEAFSKFKSDTINLAPDTSRGARASRDWLIDQIHKFPNTVDNFPSLYKEKNIAFGSFARRTKIRELDDVDFISCMSADGASYCDRGHRIEIEVPDNHPTLRNYLHAGTNLLNSTRIINAYVSAAKGVPQYNKAEISRKNVAAVINLSSYTWSFDVVPGFFTAPDFRGLTYYIIPDGYGHWQKTDPRIDRDAITYVNLDCGSNVLDIVRLMKYWNARKTAPKITSYLFETLAVYYYRAQKNCSEYSDLEIADFLDYLSRKIPYPIRDLKGLQGDLNTLDYETRNSIALRAQSDAIKAREARDFEEKGDHKSSIRLWKEIFGPEFPQYN